MPTIIPVVEGPGDLVALPQLAGRILQQMQTPPGIIVAQGKSRVVMTKGRSNLEANPEKFLKHAQNKPDCGAILVLLDADNDCPVTEFQDMSKRCGRSGVTVPVQVVYAHPEYETWFLASLNTIRGLHGIPESATFIGEAEYITDPKKWLSDQMPTGRVYKETTHQAPLSSAINLSLAYENSRSFRRLSHALEQLVEAINYSGHP